mmetsp:Transcript_18924/g.52111  ORF Transcript_18924/g.52111 Transcript_18924/m.52111 type:complete len:283 (-) Transcript_18924:197-1045(-)
MRRRGRRRRRRRHVQMALAAGGRLCPVDLGDRRGLLDIRHGAAQDRLRKRERAFEHAQRSVWVLHRLAALVLAGHKVQAALQLRGPFVVGGIDGNQPVVAARGLGVVLLLLVQLRELPQGADMRRVDLLQERDKQALRLVDLPPPLLEQRQGQHRRFVLRCETIRLPVPEQGRIVIASHVVGAAQVAAGLVSLGRKLLGVMQLPEGVLDVAAVQKPNAPLCGPDGLGVSGAQWLQRENVCQAEVHDGSLSNLFLAAATRRGQDRQAVDDVSHASEQIVHDTR